MKWRTTIPDAPGHWLRSNIGHVHSTWIILADGRALAGLKAGLWYQHQDGTLKPIAWLEGRGFWWFGPIPKPPDR